MFFKLIIRHKYKLFIKTFDTQRTSKICDLKMWPNNTFEKK